MMIWIMRDNLETYFYDVDLPKRIVQIIAEELFYILEKKSWKFRTT